MLPPSLVEETLVNDNKRKQVRRPPPPSHRPPLSASALHSRQRPSPLQSMAQSTRTASCHPNGIRGHPGEHHANHQVHPSLLLRPLSLPQLPSRTLIGAPAVDVETLRGKVARVGRSEKDKDCRALDGLPCAPNRRRRSKALERLFRHGRGDQGRPDRAGADDIDLDAVGLGNLLGKRAREADNGAFGRGVVEELGGQRLVSGKRHVAGIQAADLTEDSHLGDRRKG